MTPRLNIRGSIPGVGRDSFFSPLTTIFVIPRTSFDDNVYAKYWLKYIHVSIFGRYIALSIQIMGNYCYNFPQS